MRVAAFDPSLRNWGIAQGIIDLNSGTLQNIYLSIAQTEKADNKQVRISSDDLESARILATAAIEAAKNADVVFVEVPVGSQSASGMKSYGVCVGVLGAIRALGIPLIEVSPTEVKTAFTGNKNATKKQMIQKAIELYPDANFPLHGGKINASQAEHMADAIAAIHAGVLTPMFQITMQLFQSKQATTPQSV